MEQPSRGDDALTRPDGEEAPDEDRQEAELDRRVGEAEVDVMSDVGHAVIETEADRRCERDAHDGERDDQRGHGQHQEDARARRRGEGAAEAVEQRRGQPGEDAHHRRDHREGSQREKQSEDHSDCSSRFLAISASR